MVPDEEKVVRRGRVRLWTERFGHPGDPTVLLVMGTSTPGIGWPDELVEALVDSGRQVIRFDHRDTGRSDTVDFAAHPYALADLAADTVAVLDGHGVAAAHLVGTSLGAAIGQWLAVHQPARVRTLTAMASSPMGNNPGPAWARALTGQPAVADELPPPTARFLDHVRASATAPRTTPEQRVDADVRTWRVLNGDVLPFDEAAARRFVAHCHDRARDLTAAANHDLAGRRWSDDRRAPLSGITAATLVLHGSDDPLLPTAHGAALAALIPGARLEIVPGMGHHPFFAPGLTERIAGAIIGHTS
ncbi:alpha/beta fold hydrolase [Micromonospora yangpuensis]|uniref:Pimeloyl-ACP methyl ester carboxylesterase n=1 Tax=Micromonospora yangpuensis TaxID=683228 RepID=A0A1C6UQC6_9ACTN|nr:alpha/beta hydrolase [Micromonospora yangpuensis]SCL56208.1 Pimeloyl-ACP methyl ester carboxylesterase [Micromonospora yangpuensis]